MEKKSITNQIESSPSLTINIFRTRKIEATNLFMHSISIQCGVENKVRIRISNLGRLPANWEITLKSKQLAHWMLLFFRSWRSWIFVFLWPPIPGRRKTENSILGGKQRNEPKQISWWGLSWKYEWSLTPCINTRYFGSAKGILYMLEFLSGWVHKFRQVGCFLPNVQKIKKVCNKFVVCRVPGIF